MFAFERVLAPIQLQGDFEQRAQYAIDIAAALEAELTLLHVVNSRRLGKRNSGLSWPECAMTRTNPPCVVHRAVVHGEVPEAVARYAAFVDANLIVLSGGARSLWRRLWRASMAEKIVEATGKPVLAGNLGRVERSRFHAHPRILCMLGLGEEEDRLLVEYAQSLAEPSGGELILYAAAPRANEGFLFDRSGSRLRRQTAEALLGQLNRLGESLRVPNQSTANATAPYLGLRAAIRQHRANLVVALRRERGDIPGAGFAFDALLRHASCPVLSITRDSLPSSSEHPVQAASEPFELTARGG